MIDSSYLSSCVVLDVEYLLARQSVSYCIACYLSQSARGRHGKLHRGTVGSGNRRRLCGDDGWLREVSQRRWRTRDRTITVRNDDVVIALAGRRDGRKREGRVCLPGKRSAAFPPLIGNRREIAGSSDVEDHRAAIPG